jgi:hypothetical protein
LSKLHTLTQLRLAAKQLPKHSLSAPIKQPKHCHSTQPLLPLATSDALLVNNQGTCEASTYAVDYGPDCARRFELATTLALRRDHTSPAAGNKQTSDLGRL